MDLTYHKDQLRVRKIIEPKRFGIIEAGRRWGKTRGARTLAIERLFTKWDGEYDVESPPVVAILMPEQKRAKAIHWGPLMSRFLQSPIVADINKTDLRVVFRPLRYPDGVVRQPPDIVLAGVDRDADKVRGFRLWGVLVDEYQDFPLTAWSKVLRPALADTKNSWAIFTYTPKGKTNVAAKLKRDMHGRPNWAYAHAKSKDNPHIDPREIELAEQELPPRDFRQEWEASEEDFPGRLFSEFDRDRHLVDKAPEGLEIVNAGHDPGDVNPANVVVGRKGDKFYILRAEQMGNGQDAVPDAKVDARYAEMQNDFKINFLVVPPERPGRILALRSVIPKTIKALNKVRDGNAYVNSLWYQQRLFVVNGCWSQPGDVSFPDELSSYHRKQDRQTGLFFDQPSDGQQDHRCDALRYILYTWQYGGKFR